MGYGKVWERGEKPRHGKERLNPRSWEMLLFPVMQNKNVV